jgi:hypothetical protein
MSGSRVFFSRGGGWRIVRCLLALCVFLRVLVPSGFMPDMDALRLGRLELSLCNAVEGRGAVSMAVPLRHGHTPDMPQAHGTECPFGLMLAQVFLPSSGGAAQADAVFRVQPVVLALSASAAAFAPRGPPLGSRAPPSFPA